MTIQKKYENLFMTEIYHTLPLIVKFFLYISYSDSPQIISLFFVHFAYFLRFVL